MALNLLSIHADNVGHDLLATHPQLFSNTATFLSSKDLASITESIQAIERVVASPPFVAAVLARAHANAQRNAGAAGVFMGYDFHLGQDRPKLIEINTNAGGAFLNALLLGAQTACCPPMAAPRMAQRETIYQQFVAMFRNEWRLQRRETPLRRIAIVDVQPEKQFLYPEFRIAQQIFAQQGIDAMITAPEFLRIADHRLWCQGQPIDLVYNRLTDFSLTDESSQTLNAALQTGIAVVTPNPHHHAIHANKQNLVVLSDQAALRELGVSAQDIGVITATVPRTQQVTAATAAELWQRRKNLFFKPIAGYGSKATYRGDKLTRRIWQEIVAGRYIAQEQVAPNERGILVDGQPSSLKMDLRAYTYRGDVQLLAARLYHGQTTNFRTPGGGFSPVFVLHHGGEHARAAKAMATGA